LNYGRGGIINRNARGAAANALNLLPLSRRSGHGGTCWLGPAGNDPFDHVAVAKPIPVLSKLSLEPILCCLLSAKRDEAAEVGVGGQRNRESDAAVFGHAC
jgi:hypothetical protein